MEETIEWYFDAVLGSLVLKGYTKQQALKMIDTYKLKERLEKFTDIQLHYDVEVIADEIVEMSR